MSYPGRWLCMLLLLSGCGILPMRSERWLDFTTRIDHMNDMELESAQSTLLDEYRRDPDDATRLRLSYALSRRHPSGPQLQRARQLLAEVDATGPDATVRERLEREIDLLLQLHKAEGEILELKAQLEMLKEIEADLSREDQEEGPR